MLKDFKQFLLRGNVVDLAVGIVVGAAFTSVVNALVSDFLTPFISAVAKVPDFSNLYFTVNGSKFMYGHFLNALISFLLVATAVFFFVVKPINLLVQRAHRQEPADPTSKKCPECLSEIPITAKRCKYCTQPVA
jgi:large conductance mechanosensitive channel